MNIDDLKEMIQEHPIGTPVFYYNPITEEVVPIKAVVFTSSHQVSNDIGIPVTLISDSLMETFEE